MVILGIDPGTATTGYGLLKVNGDSTLHLMEFDLIETEKNGSPEGRLHKIYREMGSLFTKYKPDIMAIEKIFFATNAKTAIRVGQAQGVMLLSAATAGVPVVEYAPGTIKKVVSGDGRSDKRAMQKAVRQMLGPRVRSRAGGKTHFDNSADALAVALCHASTIKKITLS